MRLLAVLVLAGLVTACGPVVAPAVPDVGVGGGPGPIGMAECDVEEFAFVGETSLNAIGLGQGSPDDGRVGMVWVTAGPGNLRDPSGKGQLQPQSRFVCVQWADGSGMGMTIPDDWAPPVLATGSTGDAAAEDSVPIGPLALIVGVLMLVGVSVAAFGREAA
jgi:hypothetical protein